MTLFNPGDNPPPVTIPAVVVFGSKNMRLRGPARSRNMGLAVLKIWVEDPCCEREDIVVVVVVVVVAGGGGVVEPDVVDAVSEEAVIEEHKGENNEDGVTERPSAFAS